MVNYCLQTFDTASGFGVRIWVVAFHSHFEKKSRRWLIHRNTMAAIHHVYSKLKLNKQFGQTRQKQQNQRKSKPGVSRQRGNFRKKSFKTLATTLTSSCNSLSVLIFGSYNGTCYHQMSRSLHSKPLHSTASYCVKMMIITSNTVIIIVIIIHHNHCYYKSTGCSDTIAKMLQGSLQSESSWCYIWQCEWLSRICMTSSVVWRRDVSKETTVDCSKPRIWWLEMLNCPALLCMLAERLTISTVYNQRCRPHTNSNHPKHSLGKIWLMVLCYFGVDQNFSTGKTSVGIVRQLM